MNAIPNRQAPGELASKQHGVLSYRQLTELGIQKSFIASRCTSGEWIAQSRTIWVVAGSPDTIHRRLWIAALSRDDCFISGRSAAAIHQFNRFVHPNMPEITIPYSGDGRSRTARVTRSQFFKTTAVLDIDGLPVATAPETVFVTAPWISPRRTARIVDDLVLRNPDALAELQDIYLRYQGHRMRGMATMRPIILEISAGGYVPTESELEAVAWEIFAEADLPGLARQAPLPWAPTAGRVDLYVPDWRLIIELDGRLWHSKTEDFERDRARDNAATAAGYNVLRFTWEALVSDPASCLRTVLAFGSRFQHQSATAGDPGWTVAS
ncbi:MAG: endonuclease domain-containing protein [Acidimicrobiia bacterium]|nr:endonuclease domain-containing protein [Acidimicrobiia bacterium]